MDLKEEQIIIRKILDGENHFFEQIVILYQDMVFTLALRVIKNREEAEEIAQDVFIKVFKSLKSFNQKSKLSTWIYRITYNTSINRYKSQKKRMLTTEIDNKTEFSMGSIPDANYEISTQEKRQIINNAILNLSETEKIIITLYYYDDLPVNEIAQIVGITSQNVKVKLFRSRQKLYADLKDKVGKEILDYEYC
jgi:RNA polymerase sigma-70 factor, ECF subfamily